jgi:anti-sigma regulatory factor (Ser/Thr protein kinase)
MNSPLPPDEPWCERLACPAEPARLPELLELARSACAHMDVPAQVEHDLLLIAEEACVNVMRHAYPDSAPGPITLQVRVVRHGCTNGIELTLEDQGRPFDPLARPAVDVVVAAEDRAVGGLGVHLIRQLADRLDYRRDPLRGNVFTIEKFLPSTHPI